MWFLLFLARRQLLLNLFIEAFTCSIRNKLANFFKTVRHVVVGQKKENNFYVTSALRLYSDRARSIQFIV